MSEDNGRERITVETATEKTSVVRFDGLESQAAHDILAVEEPLEIQLAFGRGDARRVKSISVTMRTPGHDCDLAVGFLMSEGVIRDPLDIVHVGPVSAGNAPAEARKEAGEGNAILKYRPEQNIVRVELDEYVNVSVANLERNFFTTSSCGICGKASLLALSSVCPPRTTNRFMFAAQTLYSLPARLRNSQEVFERTGGLHAAGLFDASGRLVAGREDVGRHNAVDKLLGAEFLADRIPLRDRLLMLSGRASFELLQKAIMAGIPVVASVGAPSSLAVQVAREFDVTLIGFLRESHCNVYHGAHRVIGSVTITERHLSR
jgi:FdhD protein